MRSNNPPQAPGAKRRILLIDDHPLLRRGLRELIDNEPDLVVCGEAADYRAGLDAVASCRPDLVIADISLGDGDGLELVKEIRESHGDLPVLVLSMHSAALYSDRAFHAGAGGYVSKQELSESLLTAIRCVIGGERYPSADRRD